MRLPTGVRWPEWTDAPIVLYHGTLLTFAEQIALNGVDITLGRSRTDFGRGFYTTTSLAAARKWSRQVWTKRGESTPAVVRVQITRRELGKLQSLCFVRHSFEATDYWSFVQHCRAGLPHGALVPQYYDLVCGPIALLWQGPSGSSTLADSDQISFHSIAGQAMLNDKGICQTEVLA